MRKISLDVDTLKVESFDTEDGKGAARGTVRGYYTQFTCPQTQCGQECLSGPMPCYQTEAWTDGQMACFCNQTDAR
ncbi:MAG TPA: hypothetical protein VFJ82_18015 [Longimicrobium sp.]|nr:hypothetical protein [Longimicrobium sp.]